MEKTVCVTGASGFIASWLVKQLLESGYTVHATVRNPDDEQKVAHLKGLPHAADRLKLFKADLLTDGSFQEAIEGCGGVFHTASPFFVKDVTDGQAQFIDPALKGTLNVLESCAATSSVRRVMWYQLSKTLAERAAWAFAKERGLDLVVINPAMVIGRRLQPDMNASAEFIYNIVRGEWTTYPNSTMGWVHVEDVAAAHLLAYERPEASRRYFCCASWMHWKEICMWLRVIDPTLPVTQQCADDQPKEMPPLISNQKLLDLGLRFKNIETMLRDCVADLREKGLIPSS
eukprot:jgi/Mesen1/8104/ME000435S07279